MILFQLKQKHSGKNILLFTYEEDQISLLIIYFRPILKGMLIRMFLPLLLAESLIMGSPAAFATETITINGEDDWAPYSYVAADKETILGFTPQILKAAFESQGIQVKFRPVPFARCIDEVRKGKALACFDSVLDNETKAQFIHHKTPLFVSKTGVWALANSKESNVKLKDLEGQKVGVTLGYQYPPAFEMNDKIQKDTSPTELSVLHRLALGRVKYGLAYENPALLLIKKTKDLSGKLKMVGVLSTEPIFVSFSKIHPDGQKYADLLEKGLQVIKKNGTYDRLETEFKKSLL